MGRTADLEVVDEYEVMGEKRFRVRVRGSNLVLNVSASTANEALTKARKLLERLGYVAGP